MMSQKEQKLFWELKLSNNTSLKQIDSWFRIWQSWIMKTVYILTNEAQQMVEAKKNERANALKEVKRLCKEFGFTAGMLKGALAEGRKKK